MLIRVAVLLSDPDVRERVVRSLRDLGVELLELPSGKPPKLRGRAVDLLVASTDADGSSIEGVDDPAGLPERTELVVVQRRDDVGERLRLLAAGAFAVLGVDVPDALLAEALAALVRRRRRRALESIRNPGRSTGSPTSRRRARACRRCWRWPGGWWRRTRRS